MKLEPKVKASAAGAECKKTDNQIPLRMIRYSYRLTPPDMSADPVYRNLSLNEVTIDPTPYLTELNGRLFLNARPFHLDNVVTYDTNS